ncbi:MAG: hypothetical protein Q4G08_04125 [Capnocytophaga sp.]|nr:hypothetical protein [Capnocytophaga sp.]
MKKIYSIILVLFILLSCNNNKKQNENAQPVMSDKELFDIALGSPEFKESLNEFIFVRTNMRMAMSGVIPEKEIINMYNSLLGNTMGRSNDFKEIERILRHNEEDYKNYILYDAHVKYAEDSVQIEKYTALRDKYLFRMRE